MKRINKKNWLSKAKKYFTDITGKSIEQTIAELKEKGLDEFGIMECTAGNIRLFYTDNNNYASGGSGWYLSNMGLSAGSVVKL